MNVGHGCETLPVPHGAPMGGFADRQGGTNGIHDPLQVHVIVLDDNRSRIALVVADLVCVNTDLVDEIRKTLAALDIDHTWVLATHTHASPETGCLPGGAATPAPWLRQVPTAAHSATRRALKTMRPSTGTAHRVWIHEVGGIRSRQNEASTVPFDLLDLRTLGHEPLGVLVVQPIHPTVLPATNRFISADLDGAIRRHTAAAVDAPWVVVATGAAGDISTRRTRSRQDWDECDRLGREAAQQTRKLLQGRAGAPAWDATSTIDWTSEVADLPAARAPTRDPWELIDGFRPPADATDTWSQRTRETLEQGALMAALHAERAPDSYRVTIETMRIGELCLVAIPGEPFLELGESIRDQLPDPSIVLGYANGYLGYLPTRDAHNHPTYEVLVAPVTPEAGHLVETAAKTAAHRQSTRSGDGH